jgi:thiol-disulfide isomerase/thioredoxin
MGADSLRRRECFSAFGAFAAWPAFSVARACDLGPVAAGVAFTASAPSAAGAAAAPAASTVPPGVIHRPWPAGRPTPPIELPAWEGPAWRLADARGQVVVLNFWASWCEPCRSELPSLELLAERHAGDKVQVVAVNFRETDGAIRRFLAQSPISVPVLRDSDGAAARAYAVRIFPTTVVFGRNGRAAFTVTGEVDWTGAAARPWIASVL